MFKWDILRSIFRAAVEKKQRNAAEFLVSILHHANSFSMLWVRAAIGIKWHCNALQIDFIKTRKNHKALEINHIKLKGSFSQQDVMNMYFLNSDAPQFRKNDVTIRKATPITKFQLPFANNIVQKQRHPTCKCCWNWPLLAISEIFGTATSFLSNLLRHSWAGFKVFLENRSTNLRQILGLEKHLYLEMLLKSLKPGSTTAATRLRFEHAL